MKISVIIPVYNVEPYIERCLLSALNQTYQDIEIILVDDCGQDRSMEIAGKVISDHCQGYRVKIRKHLQNRGLSAARNTGIEASTGEYVYFLDSDDEITPDCIECLVSFPEEKKPDFVIGNYLEIGPPRNKIRLGLPEGILSGNMKIFRSYLKWGWYHYAWNKLINKEFLLNHRLFFKEGLLYEDTLWSFMLASCAETMGVVTGNTYYYYRRDTSITAMNGQIRVTNQLSILQLMAEYVQSRNLSMNGLIYNYGEESKAVIFMATIEDKSAWDVKKKAYRFFRTCKLKEKKDAFTIPFCGKIRDFHYSFPSFLGFYVYHAILWLHIIFILNLWSHFIFLLKKNKA
jgi:glycosyltransferase involved in cell wall biosynthesis